MQDSVDVDDADPILTPGLPIVDAHHHLWDRAHEGRYLLPDFAADTESGHNIVASVFVECRAMHRRSGPAHLRSVGEAAFVAGMAAMSESGAYGNGRLCSGFIGYADLRSGFLLEETLAALMQASGGRLRGIRQALRYSTEPMPDLPHLANPPGLMLDAAFRRGLRRLGDHGLSFDAFLIHPQLSDLALLARDVPNVTIVLNHIGGPVGFGPHAARRAEIMTAWSAHLRALSDCPNVIMKLGGLGMPFMGFGFDAAAAPVHSRTLAEAWRPYLLRCIELFGPDRCMFESNFPVDRVSCSYRTLWNTFKRVASGFSEDDTRAMFSGTARRTYRLD